MLAEVQKTIDAECKVRMHKALSFDGVNDYVVPNRSEWNDYVVKSGMFSVYYKILPLKSLHTNKIMIYGDHHGGVMFGFSSNYEDLWIAFSVESGWSLDAAPVSSIKLGEWNDYVITYDGDVLYVEENDIVKFNESIGKRTIKSAASYIGTGYIPYYPFYFRGYIAFLKVWNKPLEAGEIKYLKRHPYDPIDEEALVLDLNPAGIDVANGKWWDLSGKGNQGTNYGATEIRLVKEEVEVT